LQQTFPFTAIVGQDDLKLAVLLSVIDPAIGGVLITGHRGTAKSTAIRALADLLPPIKVVADCPYRCDPSQTSPECPHCSKQRTLKSQIQPVPVVDLPLGATEDRVVGSVDLERALVDGVQAVNLLEDHLVDLLLDVAASGRNVVEREGLSVRHPARFVLIGSGNPEEGDLRPQLLDRFGLHARIKTLHDIEQRVEVVRRRLAFENDASAFIASFEKEQSALRKRLQKAINAKPKVTLPDAALMLAAQLCDRLGIDGHRGELALTRAAVALAAYEGRKSADPELVARVAPLALAHRLRKDPLEPAADDERVKRVLEDALG